MKTDVSCGPKCNKISSKIQGSGRVILGIFMTLCLMVFILEALYVNSYSNYRGNERQMILEKVANLPKISKRPPIQHKRPVLILLLTTWRSGSSWIGSILNEIDDSFYIYEPMHSIEDLKTDYSRGLPLVQQLFQCGITSQFAEHSKSWIAMYKSKKCRGNRCKVPHLMARECIQAKYRIIKTVRLRLGVVESLLNQKFFESLKIIFLVRDVRAILSSIDHLRSVQTWGVPNDVICSKIRDDTLSFLQLFPLYPKNIALVRYEDMALDPFGKAKDIWNFIHGTYNEEIPWKWNKILRNQIHIVPKAPINNPFDISRKTPNNWQQWRQTITVDAYHSFRTNCSGINEILGYRSFRSFSELQTSDELSVTVFNCTTIPCI